LKSRISLFLICALSSAYAGTITGALQTPNGITIRNATLTFQLQQAGLIIGTGAVVPLAASCYTSIDGTVVGIPNPTADVISSIDYGSGTLPGRIYYIETTFYSGSQETLTSPELRIQLTGAGTLTITPAASVPPNATGMRVYIGTSSGRETLQGSTSSTTQQFSQAVALTSGAATPSSNTSICSVAFNDTIIPYSGYNVSLISLTGNAYPGWPQAWQLNGGLNGTVNISSGAPLWNGTIVYPQPIVAQPQNHGPQSISGPLNLSGYNLVDVGEIGFGTTTPSWPIDVENGAINASGGYLYNGAAPLNHILLGNGTAYVDSETVPASTLTGLFYQTVLAQGTAEPQEAAFDFGAAFALGDSAGVATDINLAATGVTAGSYTNPNITVNAAGQVISASDGPSIPVTQALIITTGICTTANSAYGSCTFSPSWRTAFADTGYAVSCTAETPTSDGSTSTLTLYVSAKSTTGFTLELQNGDTTSADATTTAEIDCTGGASLKQDIRRELIDAAWGILAIVLFALIMSVAIVTTMQGQNIEDQPIASQYSIWQVSGYAPDTYTGFAPTACRVQGGASFFAAFTVGTPVKIVDGDPSLTEIVTPTNVVINNNTCSISIAPVNYHNLPFYLTSATGGLQEAINANLANPATNTIVLDNKFYVAAGPGNVAGVIAAAAGLTTLGLVDVTQTPYIWYTWNGTRYVETSTGGDVTSVFGRNGVVVAQSGDYVCDQVTGCGAAPNIAYNAQLASSISSTATTIPLSSSAANLFAPGVVVIDSEWIAYTGVSGDNLTGATRGYHQTTAANHSAGAVAHSVLDDFGNPAQGPEFAAISNQNALTWGMVFGCGAPDANAGSIVQIGCAGNDTYFDAFGGIEQSSSGTQNVFASEVGVGPGGGSARITNSGFLFDTTRQNQSTVPQGFGAGIAGPIESVQPTTIAAPGIVNFAGTGSTTWSYECTGTDIDGHTYPGTVASVMAPATIPSGGEIIVTCPFSAGAASEQIWRTAGGPDQGLLFSGPQPSVVPDNGSSTSGGTPPSANSTIPKVCTAGEQYCQLSGTTSTPTVACSASTAGWTFHNVSATTSPFAYVCNATSWVTAY
jgi:hypothetical protein